MAKKMVRKKKVNPKDLQLEDMRMSLKFVIITILIIFLILFLLDYLLEIPEVEERVEQPVKDMNYFLSLDGSTKVKMLLPAVNTEGRGVNTALIVEATPGSGRTLTDIDNLLFWADTQHSIRIARRVAENITGRKMEDYDVVYTIEANASLIGGPSAGAALTIATIAALEGRRLKENVMITGSINHDGSIGPVSSILEKAKASKDVGASLFLVPLLQSRDVVYEVSEHCEEFGNSQICTTETKPKKIEVQEESGIEVKEVETVEEAMRYFFE